MDLPEAQTENQLFLERPQIDLLLENAAQFPIITVTAGAGYGKTHSVYSFIRRHDVRIVWIQLSELDNLETHFWENFHTALRTDFPDLSALLRQREFPGTERKFENYARMPQKDGKNKQDKRTIFVFDDIHLIRNKLVLRFVERSISLDMPNVSTVLISRTEIPFNLIVLESKGLLAKITEENLKFSKEEMLDYFRLLGQKVDPQTADSIYHETEGWAFAIYLAGRSLVHAPPSDMLSSDILSSDILSGGILPGSEPVIHTIRSNIFKLIESEIMLVVTPALRKFLIRLALIDYQPVTLLTEIGKDKSLITEMEQLGSFIQYNSYSDTYHIHNLLLEYLRTLQGELSGEEQKEVFLTAANWYLSNNQRTNAINYFEKAGNYDAIIDLTFTTMNIVISEPMARLLLDIMKRAPEETYRNNLRLTPTLGRVYASLGMLDEGEVLLRSHIERLEKEVPAEPQTEGNEFVKIYWSLAASLITLGSIMRYKSFYTGEYDFIVYYQRGARYAKFGNFYMKPPLTVACLPSYVCRIVSPKKGEIEKYIAALEKGIPYLEQCMSGCGLGMIDLVRGGLAFFRGILPAAEESLLRAANTADKYGQYEIEYRSLFYLVRLYLCQGNYEKIEAIRRRINKHLEEPNFINRQTYFDIQLGWFYIHLGYQEVIASWLKNDFEVSDLSSLVYGMETMVKAKYHFSIQEYPAALTVLKGQENRHGLGGCLLGMVELKVMEALCHYKMGSREESFACLEAAWESAGPNELYIPFIEQGKDMCTLIKAALKTGTVKIDKKILERIKLSASAYSKRLSLVAKHYLPQDSQEKTPAGELSNRERQILISLFQGLTGEEIAEEIGFPFNTVKSIIKRIYNKLGAVNRADALRIASDLGLLAKGD
jgi:LuxR family maltose regulon positive regulatory protein